MSIEADKVDYSSIFFEEAKDYKEQYETPIPECTVYYEMYMIYEEDIMYITRYATYDEAEDKPGIFACGGCRFVLYRVKQDDEQGTRREVICANGSKKYEDCWQDSYLLFEDETDDDQIDDL